MKFIFSFLVIIIVVAACKDGSASNTIPLNTMKVIVWDMACADELFNERQARDSVYLKMPQERFKMYEQIFAVHKISKEKFLEDLLQKLYENQIQSVLVEGGSRTLQTFIDANLWDETIIIKNKKDRKSVV